MPALNRSLEPGPSREKGKEEEGFTLIEIIVAIAVLAIGITAVVQLFSGTLRSISASGGYTKAVIAAESIMRGTQSMNKLEDGMYFEQQSGWYTYAISIQQVDKEKTDPFLYSIYDITVTLRWNEGTRAKTYSLKTLILKKKDTVTVQP